MVLSGIATPWLLVRFFGSKAKTPWRIRINGIDGLMFALGLYMVIRYFSSPGYRIELEKLVLLLVCGYSYFNFRWLADKNSSGAIRPILYCIVAFGFLQSVYALGQWFGVFPNLLPFRMGGTFGNPGDLANVLIVSFALSLGFLREEKSNPLRIVFAIVAVFLLTVLLLSKARTVWIATAGVGLYIYQDTLLKHLSRLLRKKWFYTVLVLFIILGGLGVNQLYRMKAESAQGRLFIWKQGLEVLSEKPLIGHGYNSFTSVYSMKQADYFKNHPEDTQNAYRADDVLFAYNELLHWGIEYGMVWVALFLALLYLIFRPEAYPFGCPSTVRSMRAAVLAILICSLFSYPLQNATVLFVLCILIALLSANSEYVSYVIPMPPALVRPVYGVFALILLGCLGLTIWVNCYSLKWKRISEKRNPTRTEWLQDYEKLYRILKYDKNFLYHYGTVLMNQEAYEQAGPYLEQYKMNILSSDVLVMLGDCNRNMKNSEMAAYYYQEALYTKPVLFRPKQRLLYLYQDIGQVDRARKMAINIKHSPVKVFSDEILQIKNEAIRYLLDTKSNYH